MATTSIDLQAVSAGVTDDLLIVDDKLSLTETADISSSNIVLSLNLDNQLNAIDGSFYIWATYPVYNWCCSIEETTKKKPIYQTDALFNKSWSILSTGYTLTY